MEKAISDRSSPERSLKLQMNGMPVKEEVKRRRDSDWHAGISPPATVERHENVKLLGGEEKRDI